MLHDRRQRHGQRTGKFTHRRRPAAQPLDHRSSRGVGKGMEEAVKIG
jgi:hypothetical protein